MIKITQTIPQAQKDIIVYALEQREVALKYDIKRYEKEVQTIEVEKELTNMHRELFDILGLKGLLGYEVSVAMTEPQYNCFTFVNHVDYPEFVV